MVAIAAWVCMCLQVSCKSTLRIVQDVLSPSRQSRHWPVQLKLYSEMNEVHSEFSSNLNMITGTNIRSLG